MRPAQRLVCAAALAALGSCGREISPPSSAGGRAPSAAATATGWSFVDIAAAAGLEFRHENGFDGSRYHVVDSILGGLALLDADGDGRLDIYFTCGERLDASGARPALYRSRGDGTFEDASARSGLAEGGIHLGCAVADVDGDGREDLFVTRWGPNRLWRAKGDGSFEERAAAAGIAGDPQEMSSGCAFLDMDRDGDLDVVVLNSGGAPELLRNDGGNRLGRWALLRLRGKAPNTEAIGAVVTLSAGGRRMLRTRQSSASYLSASDPRLHFGLGAATAIDRLEVQWPDGTRQVAEGLAANRLLVVTQGVAKVEERELRPQRPTDP